MADSRSTVIAQADSDGCASGLLPSARLLAAAGVAWGFHARKRVSVRCAVHEHVMVHESCTIMCGQLAYMMVFADYHVRALRVYKTFQPRMQPCRRDGRAAEGWLQPGQYCTAEYHAVNP